MRRGAAYPRGFLGEQGAWTLVGVDGGSDTGLLSDDGALEIGRSGFTLEPFVVERGKAITWADVATQPFLVDDDLPMPGVQWSASRWSLRITTFASGTPEDVRLVARYDLTNLSDQPLSLTLAHRRAAVPGESARAIPEHRRRNEPDPRPRLGRPAQ